ncbi:glycoside hydrolase family 36 protein [Actinoplanes awajinensis]|uniref:Alpha-galactosidase n=1 Tax=Actinoplanes awajinensis subsp. mycoplanecinus TaxID=135947 RepID=A0A0X3V982_9ACTN|nr:glycoside hydrolase family 36 protein [Actinoplanes awajinensis]KUL41134.1 alpha-galactosidase [Actinoplanes awajinensis subsp. mycoplanecinus]
MDGIIDTPADGPARLGDTGQPLVEILIAGEGRDHVSRRFSETSIGRRLRVTGTADDRDEQRIDQHDDRTGLSVRTTLRRTAAGAVQARTTVTNNGPEPVLLLGVTSLVLGLAADPGDLDLLTGDSEWLGEGRWTRRPLRDVLPDLRLREHGQDGRGCHTVTSSGTWSTGTRLPTGALIDRVTGRSRWWQVEHNGPWRYEVGERRDGVYLALLGPTDIDHQWRQWLGPGESFTTVPVALADSFEDLTAHRRSVKRRASLPVIFNDYMNTLMGDPTTAKLLPLVDAAAAAGAGIFCIDAGWYDNDTTWWDSVGEWQPSQTRFPGGLAEVISRIRGHGMTAGLWLEPEVIGVRSPVADKLPAEAFLQRGGLRVVEHGRYHLDLRHPAAIAHLDEVIDRLVEEFGAGYFKLDYNIDPGAGTDLGADSAGAGLLGHNRAHLDWLDGVLDRHPGLLLENCASGAMRADYALLSRMHLQSTSDQQDFTAYPPIAVAAPLSVLPEQAASWAYPQPEMTDEEIVFTMCTGLLGRLYLSGRLDAMSAEQLGLVRDGVLAHREIDLRRAVPVWPLGLPGWDDRWLSLGLRVGDTTYLGVWRRAGATAEITLPLTGRDVEVLYPRRLDGWTHAWTSGGLTVRSELADPYTARILKISSC